MTEEKPPTGKTSPEDSPEEILRQRIRDVAYLLWEASGHQHGRALDDWLAAEAEVLGRERRENRAKPGGPVAPDSAAVPHEPEGETPRSPNAEPASGDDDR
jgi:hypothetical protein